MQSACCAPSCFNAASRKCPSRIKYLGGCSFKSIGSRWIASGSIIPSSRTDASIVRYFGEVRVVAWTTRDGSSWEVATVSSLLSKALLTSLMLPP
ncbi:hypothetical protein D3C81_1655570 [compost metagenome]